MHILRLYIGIVLVALTRHIDRQLDRVIPIYTVERMDAPRNIKIRGWKM